MADADGESPTPEHRAWFRTKRVGFGFTPQTKEGWYVTWAAVIVIFVALVCLRLFVLG